jgi:hypothetical protein
MAAFGYGTKSDFTKGPNYPAPNKYEKKSFIEKGREKRKGKTFGVSRSGMGNNNWQKRKFKTPGPG